jgi:tryptophanase
MRTIIEPFKIKTVEPIRMSTPERRRSVLEEAGWNLFRVAADEVTIDLLTDSGTSAMSAAQWGGIMVGDESYAGGRSFFRFESAITSITGFAHVIPVHQGRAGERLLFSAICRAGQIVFGNTHFDTTRANLEILGVEAVDLPCPEAADTASDEPFKGNIDVAALERRLAEVEPGRCPFVLVTITNNSLGGQPVSMSNLRATRQVCDRHGIPLLLDAARFAENAYLIKLREPGEEGRSARTIARAMFDLADGCLVSAKKDGFGNMGGFVAVRDPALAAQLRTSLVLTEGFPTYGGLAGRDLEALAIGLEEVLDEDYLKYRTASTAYVGHALLKRDVPIVYPPGGHAIYVDAARLLPHIPPLELPGQTLACELFIYGGIRACELGTLMFGRRDTGGKEHPGPRELVRLAIPRRVYTQSHMDYVVEALGDVAGERHKLRGLRIMEQPALLRHFTARLEPLG